MMMAKVMPDSVRNEIRPAYHTPPAARLRAHHDEKGFSMHVSTRTLLRALPCIALFLSGAACAATVEVHVSGVVAA